VAEFINKAGLQNIASKYIYFLLLRRPSKMSIRAKSYVFKGWPFLLGITLLSGVPIWGKAPSTKVKIPDGTIVKVVITEALSSQKNHVNDPVHFEAAEDVKVGNMIVVAKGA
jgi:hypothetical protein